MGHYKRMGVSAEALGRIKGHLMENGITGDQIEGVLGGVLRVVHGMKEQGENYEMDPRLREYFAGRLTLSNDQIEGIEGIADRVVQRLSRTGSD